MNMIFDCHIHLLGEGDRQLFKQRLNQAGVDGGIVFSVPPPAFNNVAPKADTASNNVKQIMAFTGDDPNLYPFFWIDPTEDGAVEQVEMAAEAGIAGFKVICCHHYPQDDRAMKVYERVAKKRLPMLFHSGILYNPGPSGEYNRPCNFEYLMFIDGFRFALAHISWPWCDELISVFGKWNCLSYEMNKINSEMYVDVTPGTPAIFREEALSKLLTVDYSSLRNHIIFGTDGNSNYNVEWIQKCITRDRFIYDKLNVPMDIREKIFHTNMLSFLAK